MSKRATFQEQFIECAKKSLDALLIEKTNVGERNHFRLSILEFCASILGGFSYRNYCQITNSVFNDEILNIDISQLIDSITKTKLPHSVTLSILSVDEQNNIDQKNAGAYYTDFRLAENLATNFLPLAKSNNLPKIIDLSVGSGILLVYIAVKFREFIPSDILLSKCLYGADLSKNALRGTLLSLSSMTDQLETIKEIQSHLFNIDSLLQPQNEWEAIAPNGFDGVIGNPPWEKLKITIHEFLQSKGSNRHYGEISDLVNKDELVDLKLKIRDYAKSIKHLLPNDKREVDIYVPFLRLALNLTKNGGIIGQIVPASLIRNQSSRALRSALFLETSDLSITITDNKPRFFNIDSRFKFLNIVGTKASLNNKSETFLQLNNLDVDNSIVYSTAKININKNELVNIRPDLSVPEIKNQNDWNLFKKISLENETFGNSKIWKHHFYREVDMTLNKKNFQTSKTEFSVPVLEGRMIHQYCTGIKSYQFGTGRRAIWKQEISNNVNEYKPQFYLNKTSIPSNHRSRYMTNRVAFCDITGQTNERTMLATIIPAGSICGNKVPTIDFEYETEIPWLPFVWVALANSFVYDWLIRKTITTNANFFIVDSVPIPNLNDELFSKIADLAKMLLQFPLKYDWKSGEIRAKIDALVAISYNINYYEYKNIIESFNILDKLQPKINKNKSSVTKDVALLAYIEQTGTFKMEKQLLKENIKLHKIVGAIPYVPSQFIGLTTTDNFILKQC